MVVSVSFLRFSSSEDGSVVSTWADGMRIESLKADQLAKSEPSWLQKICTFIRTQDPIVCGRRDRFEVADIIAPTSTQTTPTVMDPRGRSNSRVIRYCLVIPTVSATASLDARIEALMTEATTKTTCREAFHIQIPVFKIPSSKEEMTKICDSSEILKLEFPVRGGHGFTLEWSINGKATLLGPQRSKPRRPITISTSSDSRVIVILDRYFDDVAKKS